MKGLLTQLLVAAGLGSVSLAAQAGLHHICFEAPLEMRRGIAVTRMIVGCQDDSGWCDIPAASARINGRVTVPSLNRYSPTQSEVQVPGATFAYFEYEVTPGDTVDTMTAIITFGSNKQTVDCIVEPYSKPVGGLSAPRGHANGVLTGFSTDVSGQATTGVWRTTGSSGFVQARVPADFVVVGGGAQAQDGAWLQDAAFDPYGDVRVWRARSFTASFGNPDTTQSYAVGLKLRGLTGDAVALNQARGALGPPGPDLRSQLSEASAVSGIPPASDPVPFAQAVERLDQVVLGGGISARAISALNTDSGLFAATTAPSLLGKWLRCVLAGVPCSPAWATRWQVESHSDVGLRPGVNDVRLLSLPRQLVLPSGNWELRNRMVSSTSAVSVAPKADVTGLRGEYAVTGVGAALHWRRFNQSGHSVVSTALTAIVPELAQGGASVRAERGSTAANTSVSAYAVGIKLVPPGSPPDVEEPLHKALLNVSWLCDSMPTLRETELCGHKEEWILVANICLTYPQLSKQGYCKGPKEL